MFGTDILAKYELPPEYPVDVTPFAGDHFDGPYDFVPPVPAILVVSFFPGIDDDVGIGAVADADDHDDL